MASALVAVKTFKKPSHDATYQEAHPNGQPNMWAGKPRPITAIYAKLCHARDAPDMDALSRMQFREDNWRIFNAPNHTPTIQLTKGTNRDWLGNPINAPTQQISHPWWNFDDNTDFMIAQEAGTNEFQTLFPLHFRKKGRNSFTPPNGKVVTTGIQGPAWTEPMMKLVESTLLGPAAGTNETGRRLVACQMQIPTKGPNKEIDTSKIKEVSETLEIAHEGMCTLQDYQKGPAPIDITITQTWVINKRNSGVFKRYKRQPYLRITISCASKKIRINSNPRSGVLARSMPQTAKLPAGMPSPPRIRNGPRSSPIPHNLHASCRSPGATTTVNNPDDRTSTPQLLAEPTSGSYRFSNEPTSWIPNLMVHRLQQHADLQATARAGLPTANPPPNAAARVPNANTNTSGYIDWEARRAEQAASAPDRLEDNPLGRCLLDIERRRILQEELDRQAAASTLLDTPMNAKGEALKDLEIDVNDLDQQRDEYQRLQEEADKKPAAKKGNPNDDEDKKMPAKEAKSNTKKPETKKETEIHEDKKMPASSQRPSTATPTATGTAATSDISPPLENITEEDEELIRDYIIPWLKDNDITLSANGISYSETITPPSVQQWLIRRGAVPTATPPAIAASATPPPDATDDGIAAKKAKSSAKKPVAKTAEENDEDKKRPARASSQRPSKATPTATGTAATSDILPSLDDLFLTEEEKELIDDHIIPWLSNNDFTLSDDGTFYSDSIIPP